MTNLHAAIPRSLAAALPGRSAIAPTGDLDTERRRPSLFAPLYGSAVDIPATALFTPAGTFGLLVIVRAHRIVTAARSR
ncbi:tartrate dehydrogenase, partial [Burkholderia cenocepacia]